MSGDTPTISSSIRTSSAFALSAHNEEPKDTAWDVSQMARRIHGKRPEPFFQNVELQPEDKMAIAANNVTRRLVKVVIIDPNENVPVDQCILHNGDEKLTDATDQELFFEIDIKDILAKHNAARVKLIDKTVRDRAQYLEPAKIRDLKMVVVNVALF